MIFSGLALANDDPDLVFGDETVAEEQVAETVSLYREPRVLIFLDLVVAEDDLVGPIEDLVVLVLDDDAGPVALVDVVFFDVAGGVLEKHAVVPAQFDVVFLDVDNGLLGDIFEGDGGVRVLELVLADENIDV